MDGLIAADNEANVHAYSPSQLWGAGSRVVFPCVSRRFQPVASALYEVAGYSSRSSPYNSIALK